MNYPLPKILKLPAAPQYICVPEYKNQIEFTPVELPLNSKVLMMIATTGMALLAFYALKNKRM